MLTANMLADLGCTAAYLNPKVDMQLPIMVVWGTSAEELILTKREIHQTLNPDSRDAHK